MTKTSQEGSTPHEQAATRPKLARGRDRHRRPAGQAAPPHRPTRFKNPTSTTRHFRQAKPARGEADWQDPARVASRLKSAIQLARKLKAMMRPGDEESVADGGLLQGLLSWDVMAASFHVRQRLQRENLRLRRRLNTARIKTEEVKRESLRFEMQQRRGEKILPAQIIDQVRAIYGIENVRATLPPAPVIEVPSSGDVSSPEG